MKVYIVYNHSLRPDSSYFDIIDIFDSKEKALTCVRTCADDFVKACDEGRPEGFKNYDVKYDMGGIKVESGEWFEEWYYEEYKVK